MLVVWLAAEGCSRRAERLYGLCTNHIIIVDNYARMAHIQWYYLRRRFPAPLDKNEMYGGEKIIKGFRNRSNNSNSNVKA
jgi:hypothetical protein